jgi:alanine racemase
MRTKKYKRSKTKKQTRQTRTKRRKVSSSSTKNIKGQVSIKALKHNLVNLKKMAGTEIMPVIKADAYGHGLVEMAKILRKLGTKYIGVATIGEAIILRNSGDKGRVLAWLYDINTNEVKEAVLKGIDIGVFDDKHIPSLSKQITKGHIAKIHLFVDTGINRNGIPYEKAIEAAKHITRNPKMKLVGMMSHLCCSEIKNDNATLKQLELFRKLRQDLKDINIVPELVHIGNTGGILNYDLSDFTLARSGIGIYGYNPNKKIIDDKNLTPILNLSSIIIQLKSIPKGQGIGYDRKYITHKDTYVAIVPVGYADFLPLTPSCKLSVMINGTRRKVLGLESMDQIVVEAREGDKISDVVKLMGNKKDGFIHGNVLAQMGNTTTYNMLTHVGNRVELIYT